MRSVETEARYQLKALEKQIERNNAVAARASSGPAKQRGQVGQYLLEVALWFGALASGVYVLGHLLN